MSKRGFFFPKPPLSRVFVSCLVNIGVMRTETFERLDAN